MNLISRKNNVVDGLDDLEILGVLEKFPVFMGCVDQAVEDDLCVDMSWAISKSVGMIQLSQLIPLNVLYQTHHDSGLIGGIWLDHHKKFAQFIKKQAPRSVLEIGGAHGILSREFQKENDISWTIVEPNPSPADGVTAKFIKGFFDGDFILDDETDTIVHSHVFEHVYYPNVFIKDISNILREGQQLIFSLPNMEEMLKRKYTNCINFEHTFFITEPYIEHLLSKNGFKQVGKEYFKDDHSIFYAYIKNPNAKLIDLPTDLYEHNKKLYLDYVDHHKKLIKNLNEKIDLIPLEQPIYLFGAHIFSQYLINFGLNVNRIVCLLDNDSGKQEKRLYGTNMTVESPKILKQQKNPIVILKAGIYNEEIMDDINKKINNTTIFL